MHREYDDTVAVDDIAPCDQMELTCACGHKVGPAWALWPRQARRTPIKDLRPSLRCQSCGLRGPGVTISSYAGGGAGMRVIWRWPRD